VLVLAGGLAPTATAANTPVEELTKVLPDNLLFFVATSGGDAVKGDFDKSVMGRIWNDPSMQAFCTSIKTDVIPSLQQKAQADGDMPKMMGMVLEYAQRILGRPVLIGIAQAEVKEGPPLCFFAILDAGDRKADLTAQVGKLEAMLGADKIGEVEVGPLKMRGPQGKSDVPVYWGWVGNYLVVAGNDTQGAVVKYLAKPRATPATYLNKVPGNGDALALYYDYGKLLGMLDAFAARQGGQKEMGVVKTVLAQVGLAKIGALTMRAGFSGPDLVTDVFVELPEPRTGLFAASKPVDPSLLGIVDSRAVTANVFNYDLAGLYDGVMKAIQTASPDEIYPEIQKGLAGIESELKFDIRKDLLGALAGPVVSYSLPAGTMVEAPMGGFVVVAKLTDGTLFEKTMATLGEFIGRQAKGMLQIGSQTGDDGRTMHVWTSPVLAIAQLTPTWMVVDGQLVLGSSTALCQKAIKQATSKGEGTQSLLETDRFKKATAGLPKDKSLLTLSYVDSQVQFTEMMTQLRPLWSFAVMGAMQQGIKLPTMLPMLEQFAEQMQPACEYSYAGPDGIYSHYQGSGLEVSLRGVAGAALGAGVAMPALARTRRLAFRMTSGTNLSGIGKACLIYANDHDDKLPHDLEALVDEVELSPKYLESKLKPEGFDGPSYIYIAGQTVMMPPGNIVAYDNPAFCIDGVNVLFLDSHVEFMKPEAFRKALETTYKRLGREMPKIEFKD
jgi:prepilin-type processing-associated H-X9-DG protein